MQILEQELVHENVNALTPHPRNQRQGDVGEIYQSQEANGFFGALIVQRGTGYILAGNHRYKAALEHGATHLPVLYVDVSEEEALRILLVDNRTNDLASYDEEGLADLLREILEGTGSLMGTGFSPDELDDLLLELGREAQSGGEGNVGEPEDEELLALVEKWGVKNAQVWIIPSKTVPGAAHRLGCGDSTSGAHVGRLMEGRLADLVYTDPPYGVDYESDAHGKIEGDEHDGATLRRLLEPAFQLAYEYSTALAPFYIWHASSTRGDFLQSMAHAGLEERQYIIWAKETFVLGRSHYHWHHEPCFYAVKKGAVGVYFTPDRTQSTVWTIKVPGRKKKPIYVSAANGVLLAADHGGTLYLAEQAPKNKKTKLYRLPPGSSAVINDDAGHTDLWQIARDPAESYKHPTQKPVALAARAIRNSTKSGDTVLDPFHGGGATLLACEQLGRIGYANELDPRFVAYGLERLADLGLSPVLKEKL